MGKIANRQSLAFSERGQLSQAIPQFHVERMLNKRTPIARSESRHNEHRVCEDQFLCFRGRYDRQPTLAIRIAMSALRTLASDSAITIARFRPSKIMGYGAYFAPTRPPSTMTMMSSTSGCPSTCALHYDNRAWTFPYILSAPKWLQFEFLI